MKYTRFNNSKRANSIFSSSVNAKTIGFLGIIAVALAVPATILLTQGKTETRSNASASTALTFSQPNPQVNTGDTLTMDVMMNPGQNAVSFVKLVIDYDNSQVQPTATGIVPNITAFPQVLDGPTYNICTGTSCTMSVQLSIGSNPTSAITAATKIATVSFTITGSNSQTQVAFDAQTQILSIAPSDAPGENVLSTSTPSTITIGNISNFTPSPTTPVSSSPTCDPTLGSCGNPSPTTGSITPSPTIVSNNPTQPPTNVCVKMHDDHDSVTDKTLKLAQKDIDNIEDKAQKLVNNTSLQRSVKQAFALKLQNAMDNAAQSVLLAEQAAVSGNGNGACIGQFDPNNPVAGQNCTNTPTAGSQSWWNAFTQFLQGIAGGK